MVSQLEGAGVETKWLSEACSTTQQRARGIF